MIIYVCTGMVLLLLVCALDVWLSLSRTPEVWAQMRRLETRHGRDISEAAHREALIFAVGFLTIGAITWPIALSAWCFFLRNDTLTAVLARHGVRKEKELG